MPVLKKMFLFVFLICPGLSLKAQEFQYAIPPGSNIETLSPFSEGLAMAEKSYNKIGFVDSAGKFAVEATYEEAHDFHDGLASVGKTINDKLLYGFINKRGVLVIPYQFDEVNDFSCSRAAVEKNSTWQYIGKKGRTVLDSSLVMMDKIYGNVTTLRANPHPFKNGLLLVRKENKFGYADTSGKLIIAAKFNIAKDFSNGLAVVSDKTDPNDTDKEIWSVIDTTGKSLFQTDADNIDDFSDGLAAFRKDHLWGFINKNGETVFTAQFENEPSLFSDGVAFVQVNGKAEGNKDGYLATLDATGKIIAKIPLCNASGCIYDSSLHFNEGLLAVKINDNWGYMDKMGKIVIKPQFKAAIIFQEGTAVVETDKGKLAVIRNPLKKQ